MKKEEIKNLIKNKKLNSVFKSLYVDEILFDYQYERYMLLLEQCDNIFTDNEDIAVFSSPARTEICGNHTDHQNGCVIAAAVNIDMVAFACKNPDFTEIYSNDIKYRFKIDELERNITEEGTSLSLIKGVLYKLKKEGFSIGGFKAFISSDIPIGKGLSSSASFEVLIGTIISELYNDGKIPKTTIAKAGQFAENNYFGKQCGLMDQYACAIGGFLYIDFKNKNNPTYRKINNNFNSSEISLCIIDTGSSHENLSKEYGDIKNEMSLVARYFGQETLRNVREKLFYKKINNLRNIYGDRCILRAAHFFEEQKRVSMLRNSLKKNDCKGLLKIIQKSGDSSFKYLQNIYQQNFPEKQNISVALALSEKTIKNNGTQRVHGGGFCGTIQAFVKSEFVAGYKKEMEEYFGAGSCKTLKIRYVPAKKIF